MIENGRTIAYEWVRGKPCRELIIRAEPIYQWINGGKSCKLHPIDANTV